MKKTFTISSLLTRINCRISAMLSPSSAPHAHKLGRWGENYAIQLLKKQGLRLITRNWRDGRREIDVVMLDKYLGEVVFVEVKTRTESEGLWGDIEGETLDEDQVNRITEAMSAYMTRHSLMLKRLGVRRCKLELIEVKIVKLKRVGGRVLETGGKSGIHVGRSVLLKRGLEV